MLYLIDPHRGRDDQVGLHVQCASQADAENLQRALRSRWPVSTLMTSFDKGFSHFVFVTATQAALESMWLAIELEVFNSAPTQSPAPTVAKRSTNHPEPPTPNYKQWHKEFMNALLQLQRDVESKLVPAGQLGIGAVDRLLYQQQQERAEEDLIADIQAGRSGALRPLVHLYHETGQHNKVVNLTTAYEERILALPASGMLARELIASHLSVAQIDDDPTVIERAKLIARDMLPELERLRQADEVRALISPLTIQPEATKEDLPISEHLRSLRDLLPEQRLSELERLVIQLPEAYTARLELADTLAALNRVDDALRAYKLVPADVPEREEALRRASDMLLHQRRYHEIISLLSQTDLSAKLGGRLGAAYAGLGQEDEARSLLEKAWNSGARSPLLMRPLAHLLFQSQDYEQAAEIYQMLDHDAPDVLMANDYYALSELADTGLLGDLPPIDVLNYYDQCVQRAIGSNFTHLPRAIRQRAEVARRNKLPERILDTHADWLELLAEGSSGDFLPEALSVIKEMRNNRWITSEHHFELLETLEASSNISTIRELLISEYQSIALSEIDSALRETRPESAFFHDLLRALFHSSKSTYDQIVSYRAERRAETAVAAFDITPDFEEQPLTLPPLLIALVGGHEKTRREVSRELTDHYGLPEPIEVAPSSEAHFTEASVRAKIQSCDLVVVVTRYMGHDLSNIVQALSGTNALVGRVLPLNCRGKSGIVREIVRATTDNSK